MNWCSTDWSYRPVILTAATFDPNRNSAALSQWNCPNRSLIEFAVAVTIGCQPVSGGSFVSVEAEVDYLL